MRFFRCRLPTLLEILFAVLAVAMAWYALAPTLRRARDGARVDLAARSLVECNRAVRHLLRTHVVRRRSDITLDMVVSDRRSAGRAEPVWPSGVELGTFDASSTNGCTIRVTLTDGSSVLVTTASNLVDHAN